MIQSQISASILFLPGSARQSKETERRLLTSKAELQERFSFASGRWATRGGSAQIDTCYTRPLRKKSSTSRKVQSCFSPGASTSASAVGSSIGISCAGSR
jgi:hypothetical protein